MLLLSVSKTVLKSLVAMPHLRLIVIAIVPCLAVYQSDVPTGVTHSYLALSIDQHAVSQYQNGRSKKGQPTC